LAFVIASSLDYQENKKPEADQSRSMSFVLLLIGGLGFLVMGALDYYNTGDKLHILLFFAGGFSALSAMVSDKNVVAGIWLLLLASHLFILESLRCIYGHLAYGTFMAQNDSRKTSLQFAEFGDVCFFLGAFLDVCCSYYLVAHTNKDTALVATQTVTTSGVEIASSVFWLIASGVALSVAIQTGKQGFANVSAVDGADAAKVPDGTMA